MATTVSALCVVEDIIQLTKTESAPSNGLDVNSAEKVKRCLFGAVDHQAVRADLTALRRQLDAQSCRRWNFDFQTETPLTCSGDSARWVWTRVGDSRAASMDSSRSTITHTPDKPTVKRRKMSLTPSLEVSAKSSKSDLKAVSRRKSVGGLERRRSLRCTSLLGSPSRMFIAFFY